jgi:acetate---CoA ligase (ADP-forming) subunit beta
VTSPSTTLSEVASKRLLAGYGVPVPAERLAASGPDSAIAATEIGFPVVLKLCGDAIAHKTERGLVRLNLSSAQAVVHAAEELLALARPDDGDVAVLVAPMIQGHRELIAGVATDAQFGLTVMIGVGGIFAEVLADVVFRLVPISRLDGAEMIDEMATQGLLDPFRGEPAVDRERLIDVLVGLSEAAMANPDIVSIDLNPLIISNGAPVAVDALVEIRRPS